jgi:hypothetical protein
MVSLIGTRVPLTTLGDTQPKSTQAGLGDVLSQFAAPFLDPLTPELKRQTIALREANAVEQQIKNAGVLGYGRLAAAGETDPGRLQESAIYANRESTVAPYLLTRAANTLGAGAPETTNAYMGAGHPYGGTVPAVQAAETTKRDIAQMQADKVFAAAEAAPFSYVDTDPVTGRQTTRVTSKADAIARNLQPLSTADNQRSILFEQLRNRPGGLGSATPAEQQTLNLVDKSIQAVNYETEDGTRGAGYLTPGGITTPEGVPIPRVKTIFQITGTDPNVAKVSHPAVLKAAESRTHVDNAVRAINVLMGEYSRPEAAAASGFIGTAARHLNSVRAQAEAAFGLIGAKTADQDLAADTAEGGTMGRGIMSHAQRISDDLSRRNIPITSGAIRSQIQSLAYLIAKTNDPSGRMSNQDVDRAAEILGASSMDPKAVQQILIGLRDQIVSNHLTQERNTAELIKAPGLTARSRVEGSDYYPPGVVPREQAPGGPPPGSSGSPAPAPAPQPGATGRYREGQTASGTGPNGEKAKKVFRNGRWVDM